MIYLSKLKLAGLKTSELFRNSYICSTFFSGPKLKVGWIYSSICVSAMLCTPLPSRLFIVYERHVRCSPHLMQINGETPRIPPCLMYNLLCRVSRFVYGLANDISIVCYHPSSSIIIGARLAHTCQLTSLTGRIISTLSRFYSYFRN